MERAYDANGLVRGYVADNVIYDNNSNIRGYINGSTVYDKNYRPVLQLTNGLVYSMPAGQPVGYYNGYNLYGLDGSYLGYGNSGFLGLVALAFLLGLFFFPFGFFF